MNSAPRTLAEASYHGEAREINELGIFGEDISIPFEKARIPTDTLKGHLHHKGPTYPKGVQPPLKGVVPSDWMSLVVDGEGKQRKINRTAYEICVLKAVREQLRCREIWVVGSRRYRDPEEDLPQDFEERKAAYYEDLGIPLDAKAFTAALREELTRHLKALDNGLPTNPKVKIVHKNKKGV